MIIKGLARQSATPNLEVSHLLDPCISTSLTIYFFAFLAFEICIICIYITLPSLYLYRGSNLFHKALS